MRRKQNRVPNVTAENLRIFPSQSEHMKFHDAEWKAAA